MGQSSISKYRITKRVGGGSFGDIYLGVGANGEKVAVKFEKHGARCPQLRHEYKVYRELQNAPGFAKVHYFGTQDSYNLMVMDLLGPSLEDQFNKCGRRFSLKTVLMIADQMLERVELMHSRHLIHRDIKPANFVTDGGRGNGNFIYCIDFGLSKRYRHPRTLQHIPQREGRSLTGTPRYASINNHLGVEQSRRDDLESIGYVLVYFLKGGLLLTTILASSNPDEMTSNLLDMFLCTSSREVFHGKDSRRSLPPRSTSLSWRRSNRSQSLPSVRVAHLNLQNVWLIAAVSSLKPSQTSLAFAECSVICSALKVTPTTTQAWIGIGTGSNLDLAVDLDPTEE